MNILLTNYIDIPFGKFTNKELDEAITALLDQAKLALTQIEQYEEMMTWDTLSQQLFPVIYQLNRTFGILGHLLSVENTQELRDLQQKFNPLITEFFIQFNQSNQLYKQYVNIKQKEYLSLNIEAKAMVDQQLKNFTLNGINLLPDAKIKFKELNQALDLTSTKFEQNVLDSIDSYSKYVTKETLAGIPSNILAIFHENAIADGKTDVYKLSLLPNYVGLILKYCDNRSLREEIYHRSVTIASNLWLNPALDNSPLINKIVKLRSDKAKLLGFKGYGELSIATKMADSVNDILKLIYDLVAKTKPKAIEELQELKEFAQAYSKQQHLESSNNSLEAWDIPYFSEKLRQAKYAYSTDEIRQYFQLAVVLDGLFKLIKQLYQVEFNLDKNAHTWHSDVFCYNIYNKEKQQIGKLYFDLYARNKKQSGAWMNPAIDRYVTAELHTIPEAYIVCNFAKPAASNNCLLDLTETQTIFHEMGHALHHVLTEVNHFMVAGINNVEWDAVELPSQFMEYFVWDYNILKTLTKHEVSRAIMPIELFNKLTNSRFFQSGLGTLRQLEFGLFDILVHDNSYDTNYMDCNNYLELMAKIRQNIGVIIPPIYNCFPNGFSHIFAGGYAFGYYSYKWAEILATDIFSQFENKTNQELTHLGAKFLTTILARGSTKPMLDNFKQFMGREPKIDALLKHLGI